MLNVLKISRDFSDAPGPRFRFEGEFSGEEFRETKLEPLYLASKEKGEQILVDLDDVEGYATSFLEEAFGGLRRLYPDDDLFKIISLKAEDESMLIEEVQKCVAEALDK